MILFWDNDKSHDDTVSVARDLRLPQFEMQKITTNRCGTTNHMGKRYHLWIIIISRINTLSWLIIKFLQFYRKLQLFGCGVSFTSVNRVPFDSKLFTINLDCCHLLGFILDGYRLRSSEGDSWSYYALNSFRLSNR